MLVTKPDPIPGSLTTELGCATATNPVVENICSQAANGTAKDNEVFAIAQSAGQLTNFGLVTWIQRPKFKLINPLLGNNCYIGNDNQPIVVNPSLSLAPGVNSLALNGAFAIAACSNKKNQANILVSAFRDSSTSAGTRESVSRISFNQLHSVLQHVGMRSR